MTKIALYKTIKQKVVFLYYKLKLEKQERATGRKLAVAITDILSLSLFKQHNDITTKKAIFEIFRPRCSYKTLVVNMNRFARLAGIILALALKANIKNSHLIKHTDSTDIPVCLNKNAKHHKTMSDCANWGHSGKGWFYGLKLHITSDLKKKILALRFTSGNVHDQTVFMKLNKGLSGVFVADAAYTGEKLAQEFYQEHKRILFAKPRKNMKKLMTKWQEDLYKTRMLVEINFRVLKMFHGLVTSLPRSRDGYLANYIHSLLAYILA